MRGCFYIFVLFFLGAANGNKNYLFPLKKISSRFALENQIFTYTFGIIIKNHYFKPWNILIKKSSNEKENLICILQVRKNKLCKVYIKISDRIQGL